MAERPAYQKYAVHEAPSAIDGTGVFADEAVPARRKIGEIRGESISVYDARIRATRTANFWYGGWSASALNGAPFALRAVPPSGSIRPSGGRAGSSRYSRPLSPPCFGRSITGCGFQPFLRCSATTLV